MKKYIKRNQVLITALAIMIAVAGYLSFRDKQDENTEATAVAQSDEVLTYDLSMEDLADEELYLNEEEGDYQAASNFLETDMELIDADTQTVSADSSAEILSSELEGNAEENEIDSVPGEAIFTSSGAITTLSGAKLLKEQTRAKNKETLMEIINNINISDEAKAEAITQMVSSTEVAEKEMSAEIMLEAKGFSDSVVSITNDTVDVCVVAESLSDAQRAQIEDIVCRKTEIEPEKVVITTVW